MALTSTTLNGAITPDSNAIYVASATGFVVGAYAQIDSEMVKLALQDPQTATRWLVTRGQSGTAAVAHAARAGVTTGLSTDFPQWSNPTTMPNIVSYSVAGAIAIPDVDSVIELNGAAAIAMTLASPTNAQEGRELTIVARSAFAHTVTYAPGFSGGGGSKDVATYAAAGDLITIKAVNGVWCTQVLQGAALS